MALPFQARVSGAPERPGGRFPGAAPGYVGPRTSTERLLTEILEEFLDVDRVGVDDSFFELGGFSLHATQLTTRIRATFNVELAVRDVFERPTIGELAQLIIIRAKGSGDAG